MAVALTVVLDVVPVTTATSVVTAVSVLRMCEDANPTTSVVGFATSHISVCIFYVPWSG